MENHEYQNVWWFTNFFGYIKVNQKRSRWHLEGIDDTEEQL